MNIYDFDDTIYAGDYGVDFVICSFKREPFLLIGTFCKSIFVLIKYIISYTPNFIILFSFVAIFIGIFNWSKLIVYILATILGIPITYIFVKLFAFAKKKVEKNIKVYYN